MKLRAISGACFVAIVAGFFLLRELVDYRLFDFLIWFLCGAGTFEVARALKPRLGRGAFVALCVYGAAYVPFYALFEYLLWKGMGWVFALSLTIIFCAVMFECRGGEEDTERSSAVFLPVLYPSALLLTMLALNGHRLGFTALLLVFVISPLTDTFAYLVGKTYGMLRGGKVKKLCPAISPNKTVAGALGGLAGGVIGAFIVYFAVRPDIGSSVPALIFALIGLAGAVFTQAGDLFESLIKRRAGIKDMGKIMPGHGGVMDRIDGISFASAFIWFVFLWI